MPKEFDKMVNDIKKSLKTQHPTWSEDKISSSAFAIATDRWKKTHGGKKPMEKLKDWHILEYFMPIEESFLGSNNDFLIRGVAINETTTLNNVKYVAEELEKAAVSFRNVPILLDHKNEVRNIVGRTTEKVSFNPVGKRIDFEGKIMDKDIQEMIKDGRIGSVSIGAKVENLSEEEDGSMKAIGIKGLEISLVAVPGDSGATLAHALEQSFLLKEMVELENSKLNNGGKNMTEEEVTQSDEQAETEAEEETQEETQEETKEESVKTTSAKVNMKEESKIDLENIKNQIRKELLKELLTERKAIKEKVVDKTVGIISAKTDSLESVDNRIIEAFGRGTFAIYRDYGKESPESNLKRLVR